MQLKINIPKDVRRSRQMIDNIYFKGYEGEGEVDIWYEQNNKKNGLRIQEGFFETILDGCYNSNYNIGGLIDCYCNKDGFYDEKWIIRNLAVVIRELQGFNENKIHTNDTEIILMSKKIINKIILLINESISNELDIFIESN